MKLSILICSLESRVKLFNKLFIELDRQRDNRNTTLEILVELDNGEQTTGAKRSRLLDRARGEYVCFIDDDDFVSPNYINLLLEGIDKGVDCCSLKGVITFDGINPKVFIHSDRYDSWYEENNIYYRCVNHLNCIKKSIALQIGFPDKTIGEDHDFSKALKKSGLIKTEHWIDDTLYLYDYKSKK